MKLSFTVYGPPVPQGSTKAFIPKGWKRAIITSDNKKLKPWRQDVAGQALSAMEAAGEDVSHDAIGIRIRFIFAKPKSTSKKVLHKTTKPDIDKLLRGALDALTGIAFVDDAQVVSTSCTKQFGSPERADIEVCSFAVKGDVVNGAVIPGQCELPLLEEAF
jgi:Holliday junction resolvase RusA-like endonuclease